MISSTVRRSISKKFMLAVLATTFSALFATAVVMLLLDIQAFRTSAVNDLATQADILGKISIPALEFNDTKVAQENLAQLRSRRNFTAAAIYRADGSRFVSYSRDEAAPVAIPTAPKAAGFAIDGNQIRHCAS